MRDYFAEKGYVKFNENRSTSKSRNYLQSEFQLMFKLGLKKKFKGNTLHFDDKEKYGFNIKLIKKLVNDYNNQYPSNKF